MRGFRIFILGNLFLSVLVMFPDWVRAATARYELPQPQSQLVHLWSQGFGNGTGQEGWGVAFDPSGNVVMTGYFYGTMDFGGDTLTSVVNSDIFLAKYDANGTHLWSQQFGDADYQFGYSVAFDAVGNVVMTGNFAGTVDFGGGPLTSAGVDDIFLAKFDANGTHLWSQGFGDASNFQDGYSVAFDPSGNVVMTGQFGGTVDFGGGTLTSAGQSDIFLAKFGGSVGVEESPSPSLSTRFRLYQNFPNPFHPTTTIRYQIPLSLFTKGGIEGGFPVRVAVYDITGRLVEILVNERQEPGVYQVQWEGKDQASGIYFYRLQSGDFIATKKLILLR